MLDTFVDINDVFLVVDDRDKAVVDVEWTFGLYTHFRSHQVIFIRVNFNWILSAQVIAMGLLSVSTIARSLHKWPDKPFFRNFIWWVYS